MTRHSYYVSYAHSTPDGRLSGYGSSEVIQDRPMASMVDILDVVSRIKASNTKLPADTMLVILNFQLLRTEKP